MQEYSNVADDAVVKVLNIMRTAFKDRYKQFYDGDPIAIPKNCLPAIIVETPQEDINSDATSTDRIVSRVRIKLVRNKADDYGVKDDHLTTESILRRHVMARDRDTRMYIPGTVMHALRTHITLYNSVTNQSISVAYKLSPRAYGIATSEVHVMITTTEKVLRPPQSVT